MSKVALPKMTLGTSRNWPSASRIARRSVPPWRIAADGEVHGIERIGVECVRFGAAVFRLEARDELAHLGPGIVREIARAGVHALDRIAAKLDEARRIDRARRDHRLLQADLPHGARDQCAVGRIGDEGEAVGIGVARPHQRGAEIALLGLIALRNHDLRAELLRGAREVVLAGASPVGVEVEDGDPLQTEPRDGVGREQRLLVRLADGGAPHEVAGLGEVRMRIGEAVLNETGALIDRRRGHRGRAREIAELDDDPRIGHEFLRDRDRLARIALAVLEHIGDLASLDAAFGVDLVQRKIEPLLPLQAVLRVGAGERTAHADENGIGLGEGRTRQNGAGDGGQCCTGEETSRYPDHPAIPGRTTAAL